MEFSELTALSMQLRRRVEADTQSLVRMLMLPPEVRAAASCSVVSSLDALRRERPGPSGPLFVSGVEYITAYINGAAHAPLSTPTAPLLTPRRRT